MRIILLLFLFLSTYSFAQKDSTTKVSFICMSNIGILYPDFTFPEYSSNSNGYSYFVVSPKLGFNTNLLAGVSTNIFKSCNLENVLGIGYSKNNYMKSGFRVSYGGIAGLDTFNGIIKESNIENVCRNTC